MSLPLGEIKQVLVVKLAHLGDVLLAAPVVSVLKRRAPHAEVDALVYAETAPMLSGHPGLTGLLAIRRGDLRAELDLVRRLRARRYDLMVALSDKPRIALLARLGGVRYAVTGERADRGGFWRRSFTHFYRIPPGNTRHTVEVHLDALRALGIEPAAGERRVVMVPGADAERRIDALGLPGRFVVIHPASRWLFKCWPAARLAELINQLQALGERVVLTGAPSPEESALVDEMVRGVRAPVINLSGRLGLKELAALIGRARLFLGVDSAPMHMASAMGTPAVALFGPSGDVEWGPWMIPHRIVSSSHSCRPCGHNGCGGGNRSDCMESIAVQPVLAAVEALAHGR
jgi:heptosyltransferase III